MQVIDSGRVLILFLCLLLPPYEGQNLASKLFVTGMYLYMQIKSSFGKGNNNNA